MIRLIAGGYSNREVARQLGSAVGTVYNQVVETLRKLGVRDRTHAVLKAMAARLLSGDG